MQENPSQTTQILLFLKDGNFITPLMALEMFGCFRLSGRIYDIKKMGFTINSKLIKTSTGKNIAQYSLIKTYGQTSLNFNN